MVHITSLSLSLIIFSDVANEYLKLFEFSKMTIDAALRLFLSKFCLIGETQERERVISYFSLRYLECNPEILFTDQNPFGLFKSSDSLHILICAILLLNTDLHGESFLPKRMSCIRFIQNLSEQNEGNDFPNDLLMDTYYNIKDKAIPWGTEIEENMAMDTTSSSVPNFR